MLSLVVNGPSSIPLWMEPLDGNSSDKKTFHETIQRVNEFQKQIELKTTFKWVADSALYTQGKLLKNNGYKWLTRVPETLSETKKLLGKSQEEVNWIERGLGYKTCSFNSSYGGVEQRWLLVFSKQAYEREKKTLEKKLTKEDRKLKQQLWHLSHEIFECEIDAQKALKKVEKKNLLYRVQGRIVACCQATE